MIIKYRTRLIDLLIFLFSQKKRRGIVRRYTKRKKNYDFVFVILAAIIIVTSICLSVFFISNYNKNMDLNNKTYDELSNEVASYEKDYASLEESYKESYENLKELSDELSSLKK